MVQNPPEGSQRVIPYLIYTDAAAALEFLCQAFGFEERFRIPGPDGTIMHAEIGYKDNVVMLATAPGEMGSDRPADLGRHALIACYVDDVDAHYARAREAGATILEEPADQFYGDRSYHTVDTEGNHWYFQTHVKDVPLDQMRP